jgi:hypothetical protein
MPLNWLGSRLRTEDRFLRDRPTGDQPKDTSQADNQKKTLNELQHEL